MLEFIFTTGLKIYINSISDRADGGLLGGLSDNLQVPEIFTLLHKFMRTGG
jgi:hypothetical protein